MSDERYYGSRVGYMTAAATKTTPDEWPHLRPAEGTGDALNALTEASWDTPAPCHRDPDAYTAFDRPGHATPTPEDAAMMCWGCHLVELCADYAEKAQPFGVWGGRVYLTDE